MSRCPGPCPRSMPPTTSWRETRRSGLPKWLAGRPGGQCDVSGPLRSITSSLVTRHSSFAVLTPPFFAREVRQTKHRVGGDCRRGGVTFRWRCLCCCMIACGNTLRCPYSEQHSLPHSPALPAHTQGSKVCPAPAVAEIRACILCDYRSADLCSVCRVAPSTCSETP